MNPFTLTSAAVTLLAHEHAEEASPGDVVRILVFYTRPLGPKHYRMDLGPPEKDDVILEFPDGPLTVAVDRTSFLDMIGMVLDVIQIEGAEKGHMGCWFRKADRSSS